MEKAGPKPKSQPSFFKRNSGGDFFVPQAKMQVNQPGDAFEQEADKAADHVVSMKEEASSFFRADPALQRKDGQGMEAMSGFPLVTPLLQKKEDEPPVQQKADEEVQRQPEEDVQRKVEEEPVQAKEEE
nr:hypothetical protein [Cytophagales bacterium]